MTLKKYWIWRKCT